MTEIYACDDDVALHFVNEIFSKAISYREGNGAFLERRQRTGGSAEENNTYLFQFGFSGAFFPGKTKLEQVCVILLRGFSLCEKYTAPRDS